MSESGGADVKIRLVVDDSESKGATSELKEDLKESSEHASHLKGHGKDLGSELLKANLYTKLVGEGAHLVAEGMHQAFEMAESFADAATEASDELNTQTRAMAGLMSFMDKGAHSMDDLRGYAYELREELSKSGTAAGVATSAMVDMYDRVIEHGTRTTEQAKELVEQMAVVGKVVPRGMEGLAEGFNMMELGIVRARNPLVQLIAATGVLKGNAHAVAAAMQHMAPAKQIELAQKAISQQAAALGGGGMGMPTMSELKNSFGNIREGFLEAVGQPLLDKVVPSLSKLRDYLQQHSEEIAEYGSEVGERMAEVVGRVEDVMADVYSGAVHDWDAIRGEFEGIEADFRDMWALAMGDTDEVHHKFKELGLEFAEAMHTGSKYLLAAAETIANLIEQIKSLKDHPFSDTPEWGHASAEAHAKAYGQEVKDRAKDPAASSGDFDESISKYAAWAKEAGAAAEDVDKWVEGQRAIHEAAEQELEGFRSRVEAQDPEGVAKEIDKARATQNEAMLYAELNYVGSSESMTKALMDGAIKVQGGFDSLKEVIGANTPELAEMLKKIRKESFGEHGIKGQGPSVVFNGAQFHMQNDFRDQDPDRIMRMFKSKLAGAAVNRRQARTALYGGL